MVLNNKWIYICLQSLAAKSLRMPDLTVSVSPTLGIELTSNLMLQRAKKSVVSCIALQPKINVLF